MLRCSGSSQDPGSSVLDELQLSNGLLWKETITIIHPAGDKGMNKFLQVLTGNKTSNSCNVFEHYRQRVHSRSISRVRTRYKDCPNARGEHIKRLGLLE